MEIDCLAMTTLFKVPTIPPQFSIVDILVDNSVDQISLFEIAESPRKSI